MCDETKGFGKRLCHQQAIKRICVQGWECLKQRNVRVDYGHFNEARRTKKKAAALVPETGISPLPSIDLMAISHTDAVPT